MTGKIYEVHSIKVETPHMNVGYVVGMKTPENDQVVKRILYDQETGQIEVKTDAETYSFNRSEAFIKVGNQRVKCKVVVGSIIRPYRPTMAKRRPDAPPPLKRREPTGFYNPLTGESFKAEKAHYQSQMPSPHEEELKLMHDYLAESERKNKVLTEKLDSMRNAYHAECEENARLKNQLPVPYERHEIMVDDSGEQIAVYETNDVEFLQNRNRELESANREKATIVRWYERRLEDEKKVSSHLTDEDRFKATMSGALGSAGAGAIVYSLFNIFF